MLVICFNTNYVIDKLILISKFTSNEIESGMKRINIDVNRDTNENPRQITICTIDNPFLKQCMLLPPKKTIKNCASKGNIK